MKKLGFKKLSSRAQMPEYKTEGSAGADLFACLEEGEEIVIKPSEIKIIKTGIILELPHGYEAQVRPRSGLALKNGITIPNSPGTVDSDYRGELAVILQNLGKEDFKVTHGMRVAQVVIVPVSQFDFFEIEELSETKRGASGFGSTGTH